jgi:hypothetical protein
MVLPPPDCRADLDSWNAERIYEMDLADGKIATTDKTTAVARDRAEDAPKSSDSLAERVAEAIFSNGTSFVDIDHHAAIHTIANWLDQQELHAAATRLRMEVE